MEGGWPQIKNMCQSQNPFRPQRHRACDIDGQIAADNTYSPSFRSSFPWAEIAAVAPRRRQLNPCAINGAACQHASVKPKKPGGFDAALVIHRRRPGLGSVGQKFASAPTSTLRIKTYSRKTERTPVPRAFRVATSSI
jgi:hypothetical protein